MERGTHVDLPRTPEDTAADRGDDAAAPVERAAAAEEAAAAAESSTAAVDAEDEEAAAAGEVAAAASKPSPTGTGVMRMAQPMQMSTPLMQIEHW